MIKKRKVAIFTGNRAEYGLQFPIIKAISLDDRLDYYLLVGGAHLEQDFGYSKQEIEKDGFQVYSEIPSNPNIGKEDTLYFTTQAIGHIILNLSSILNRLKPDFLVVYADRFEGLGALIAGANMGIPVAHIEGGDITEGGALDDYVRHAMTKLAHLHFTTNSDASERIKRLGEEAWRIKNVGLPAIDLIIEKNFASLEEVYTSIPIKKERPIILFTQHSITTDIDNVVSQITPSLKAIEKAADQGVQVIITYPNNDAGGRKIIQQLETLKGKKNMHIFPSLGRYLYHGVLNICGSVVGGVCVGNSSSGIKEAPAFGCPFVNVGTRQKSRLRASNVLDVSYDAEEIYLAIQQSLFDEEFREKYKNCENPYGEGSSGKKISDVLATIDIDSRLIQKKIMY